MLIIDGDTQLTRYDIYGSAIFI